MTLHAGGSSEFGAWPWNLALGLCSEPGQVPVVFSSTPLELFQFEWMKRSTPSNSS